nr:Fe-S cluster assembly protein SufD [Cryptomonas curvata]|mmetsp:Transcript_36607/g.76449  ORF Transcript_36607/g.76449 Transcript_36607/m.76449 type:complete len:478 (-) Transcript_36607:93-1526(-)
MILVPTLKVVSFFSKEGKLFTYGKFKAKSGPRVLYKLNNLKTLENCMISENDYVDTNSNWTKPLVSSKKTAKNKLIRELNRAGNSLLKTIPFPSKEEESYRFISLDKLFQMGFQENSTLSEKKIPNQLNINNNDVWLYFVNGIYSNNFSSADKLPKDFYFGSFSDLSDSKQKNILDISNKGESGINGGFFSALNAACLEDIIVLLIPESVQFKQNINIVFEGQGLCDNFYLNQKLVIISSKNSVSRIVQYHIGTSNSKYFDNTTTSIILNENSKMEYSFINQVPESASQITSIHVEIQKNAHFEFSSAALGGFLSRTNLGIDINGINSSAKLKGISLANKNRIVDIHSRISHNYPECFSSQLHKNLVSEKGHAIFAGKIQVHSGSFNTESEQLCKTLLLSSTSRIDAMPILEINNDNVKCTHGATVSDLDKNQIFYFLSRGISIEIARKLLTSGFIKDVIDFFPDSFEKIFFPTIES